MDAPTTAQDSSSGNHLACVDKISVTIIPISNRFKLGVEIHLALVAVFLPCVLQTGSRLEVVADAAALTATMLEVLPVCSPSIQRQLICILPEVAQPQDHSLVLEQLQGLLEADVTFMAPVVECLGNMMLEPALQVGAASLAEQPGTRVDTEQLSACDRGSTGRLAASN